jgi:DNA repair protein RadC
MKRVKDIPKDERPREKLAQNGPRALSDVELIAILIGRGTKGHDVMSVANRILSTIDSNGGTPDCQALQKIEGVGLAKATLIVAALEFARRRIKPEGLKISFPADVLPLIQHYADRKQEHFLCVSLNGSKEVIATRVISVGLVNKTHAHPREVFAEAIAERASAVIVAHNHPSGGVNPSKEDMDITARLRDAGEILGIKLLDHVIFNHKEHYSFLEQGGLRPEIAE